MSTPTRYPLQWPEGWKRTPSYQRKTATNGSPFFNLTATNGQIIGHSEMYSSAAARDNGIESVKSNGPTPTVKDNT